MGNGKLLIGPGLGDAQVFDPSQSVQNFANIMAKQKAQRDTQVKQLQDQLAKSSPAGIREPDRQGYMDRYSQLQAKGRQMINERDPYKKAQLQAEVDKGFQDLGGYVSDSKQGAATEKMIQQEGIKNKDFYNTFADDAHDKMMRSFGSSMDSGDYIKDFGSLQRQPDMDKWGKRVDDIAKQVKGNAKSDTDPITGKFIAPKQHVSTINGQKGTWTQSTKYIDQAEYAHRLLNDFDTNKDTPMILAKMYPQIATSQDIPPEQKKSALVSQYIKDHPIDNIAEEPKYQKPRDPVRPSWIDEYNMNKYGTPNAPKGTNSTNDYVAGLSKGLRTPESAEQTSQQLNAIIGSNQAYQHGITIQGKDVNGRITSFTVPAKYKFDAKKVQIDDNGKPIPNSGRVIDKPAYTVKLDPNKPDEYDAKIANVYKDVTGDQSATVSKVETKGKQQKTEHSPKITTLDKIASKVGAKGYEGYTKQELIDYYKAQGYTIK